MNIRPSIQQLVQLKTAPPPPEPEENLISVSSATRRIAFAYERFRNTLEPDEQDILRRKAIFRILERRLQENRSSHVTATALLQELIRAHYIQPVGQRYVSHIAQQLERAQAIEAQLEAPLADWFLRLVAVLVDRILYPRTQEEALVQVMYTDAVARAVWTDDLVEEDNRATQLYVACHRALFAADEHEISYHYFVHTFPAWTSLQFSEADEITIVRDLPRLYEQVRQLLRHPARDRLQKLLRPAAVPYRIVRDLIRVPDLSAFAGPPELQTATYHAIQARMQRIRQRMSARAWHSILFLFLTKIIIALVVELPYELFVLQQRNFLPILANTTFHPLLLFFFSTSARLPGANNTERLAEQVQKIVTGSAEMPTIVINATRTYGALTWSFFALVYAALFMAIFWFMFRLLDYLHFSLLAMFLFVVFLGLVSFLSVRIRRSVEDVRVLPRREGALTTLVSFLALPILEFGRWLAHNISQINLALFLMDRVLEAPFKILIDIIEEWFLFVRERREEII